ncbi:15091_t:CDS:2, partial [Gigaspora rosea]
ILEILQKSNDPLTSMQIVEVLYAAYPRELWKAAEHSIKLHLIKLETEGKPALINSRFDRRQIPENKSSNSDNYNNIGYKNYWKNSSSVSLQNTMTSLPASTSLASQNVRYDRKYWTDKLPFCEFEAQEENWPVFEQNFKIDGWNNIQQDPGSSNWTSEELFNSANTDKTLHYE